jgi:hypothetical protein
LIPNDRLPDFDRSSALVRSRSRLQLRNIHRIDVLIECKGTCVVDSKPLSFRFRFRGDVCPSRFFALENNNCPIAFWPVRS